MRTSFIVFSCFLGLVTACSSAGGGGNGDGGGGNGDGSANGDGGGGGNDGGGNPNGGPISFPAQCPAFAACGGSLSGTAWDYTAGCIDDAFKDFQSLCPSLQVTNQTGTVKGTVTFTGAQVTRTGQATYSATIVLPVTCTQGVPCSTFSTKGATCTGTGSCSCQVTRTDSTSDTDSYTVQGSKIVTGSGNEYNYCVQGSKLQYTEGGANPQHVGVFDLAKR